MDATTELTGLSGLQQLQAIFAGKTGYAGIVKTLDLHPVSVEEGFVVFGGSPTQAVYNPLGSVHGGYAATLLDTVPCILVCRPDKAIPHWSLRSPITER
jgi:acyl-coenzyme A thioesterase PaaI-like protein